MMKLDMELMIFFWIVVFLFIFYEMIGMGELILVVLSIHFLYNLVLLYLHCSRKL